MKVLYFLCCESTSFDMFTNRLSLFHVFEFVVTPAFPIVLPSVAIALAVEREDGDNDREEATIQITLGDEILGKYDINIDFGEASVARAVGNMQSLYIAHPGLLQFTAFNSQKTIASYNLSCQQSGSPQMSFNFISAEEDVGHVHVKSEN